MRPDLGHSPWWICRNGCRRRRRGSASLDVAPAPPRTIPSSRTPARPDPQRYFARRRERDDPLLRRGASDHSRTPARIGRPDGEQNCAERRTRRESADQAAAGRRWHAGISFDSGADARRGVPHLARGKSIRRRASRRAEKPPCSEYNYPDFDVIWFVVAPPHWPKTISFALGGQPFIMLSPRNQRSAAISCTFS